MKKNYQQPIIEVIKIEANNILAGSGPGGGAPEDPGVGGSREWDETDLFGDEDLLNLFQ